MTAPTTTRPAAARASRPRKKARVPLGLRLLARQILPFGEELPGLLSDLARVYPIAETALQAGDFRDALWYHAPTMGGQESRAEIEAYGVADELLLDLETPLRRSAFLLGFATAFLVLQAFHGGAR